MRGKRAKQLRKNSLIMGQGAPVVQYSRAQPPVFAAAPDTTPTQFLKVQRGVPTVLLRCSRLIYKVLKRLYKRGGDK